jgi:monovalent cation:H+ antiporter, CPA1 family
LELTIEQIEFLLLVAAGVAMLARRLHIPYSVGLVMAGIGLALIPLLPVVRLTKELVFGIFLPPLVFEAALNIHWNELRRDLLVILTLATLGVAIAAGLTAADMHYIAKWDWASAALFGVLIAATDPVSVIATFKESNVRGRLRLLVEAESLFNDGTAAVAFAIVLALAAGAGIRPQGVAESLALSVSGGLLCGGLIAGGMLLLAGQTQDHLVEITLSTVAAYGSFLLAEHFHVSGVLASLTAGIIFGNLGALGSLTDKGRDAVESFWEYVAFVVNSLVFILIGINGALQGFASVLPSAAIAIALVLLGRALSVYACCALFARSEQRVARRHQHILVWGGLRGALALALALGLPSTAAGYSAIVSVTFAVVAFSIFVQGLTITRLLKHEIRAS